MVLMMVKTAPVAPLLSSGRKGSGVGVKGSGVGEKDQGRKKRIRGGRKGSGAGVKVCGVDYTSVSNLLMSIIC